MANQYTPEQREKLIAEVRASGERVSVVAKRMGDQCDAALIPHCVEGSCGGTP